jgi:hypothetical protein
MSLLKTFLSVEIVVVSGNFLVILSLPIRGPPAITMVSLSIIFFCILSDSALFSYLFFSISKGFPYVLIRDSILG